MKYIALTLGPITRTIEMAENTRSLWAASYLFSYLGKQIIQPFKERKFLLPYISNEMFEKSFKGAGVFPDRYIFKAETISGKDDFDALTERVETVIHELAASIGKVIRYDDRVIEAYLKKFFKVYFFEKDFKAENEKDIKKACEKSLALLEMQDSVVPKVNDSMLFLNSFFDRVTNSFLAKDAGLEDGFQTIVKISSGDDVETPKHPHQRYVAIVKADGDSMGKAFENVSDSNKLSQALFEFNKEAVKAIHAYNGLPVYIGGDDLLFFAPVYTTVKEKESAKQSSLFSLLQELDNKFHSCIKETELEEQPTLSFGVSITYYKYPMFEALKLADSLLGKAKAGDSKNPKNNIVFSIQKHSGQTRAALLHKGNESTLLKFNTLTNDFMVTINEEEEEDGKEVDKKDDERKSDGKKVLASVMHGLREKEQLLTIALEQESMLGNFFDNNYDEPVHKKYIKFFTDLKELLWASYQEFSESDKLCRLEDSLPKNMMIKDIHSDKWIATPEKAAIETAYNALQFVHLINQRNDERDENL